MTTDEYQKKMLMLQECQLAEQKLTNQKLDKLQTHLENHGFGYNSMVVIERACEAINSLSGSISTYLRNK